MTTRTQLRKSALGLPEAEEGGTRLSPKFVVHGKTFAELTEDGLVRLQLDPATIRRSLSECTITQTFTQDGEPEGAAIPITDVNGMELNSLVFKSWLAVAPAELAAAAREAVKGDLPVGPDALPSAIGKPATRALLLAGIETLGQVAERTESELLELHGVGPRAVRILREALRATGRDLATYSPPKG